MVARGYKIKLSSKDFQISFSMISIIMTRAFKEVWEAERDKDRYS
jgi:hypothetical protein